MEQVSMIGLDLAKNVSTTNQIALHALLEVLNYLWWIQSEQTNGD